jgi:phospholipid transport system substrate-binding protein
MGKALAAWLMLAFAVPAPVPGPRETVRTAVEQAVAVLEAAGPERTGARQVALSRIAHELFDFDEMSRRALARHWDRRSAAERAEFAALFADLVEHAWVTRLSAHPGAAVTYISETVDGRAVTVRSRLATGGSEVAVDYRLHVRDARWRVRDVVVDGISVVAAYRGEFRDIIEASSFAHLVARLRESAPRETAIAGRP